MRSSRALRTNPTVFVFESFCKIVLGQVRKVVHGEAVEIVFETAGRHLLEGRKAYRGDFSVDRQSNIVVKAPLCRQFLVDAELGKRFKSFKTFQSLEVFHKSQDYEAFLSLLMAAEARQVCRFWLGHGNGLVCQARSFSAPGP